MAELWFVTGGARSGKSRFAEALASGSGRPVIYLATMEPLDDELVRRVAEHRASRPPEWRTVEEPRDPASALAAADGEACVILDCLSLWVSNLLVELGDDPSLDVVAELDRELEAAVGRLLHAAAARSGKTIVVTNEVGAGVVPETPLGRAYRDLLGRVNQRVAAAATRAWLLVAGRPLQHLIPDSGPFRRFLQKAPPIGMGRDQYAPGPFYGRL